MFMLPFMVNKDVYKTILLHWIGHVGCKLRLSSYLDYNWQRSC